MDASEGRPIEATGSIASARPAAPPVTGGAVSPRMVGVAGHARSGDVLHDAVVAELERDPGGGTSAAVDRFSASITYDPTRPERRVPGASLAVTPANSLAAMTTTQADALSMPDFLAASQSTLAAAVAAGPTVALGQLAAALRPAGGGPNAWDRRIARLDARRDDLVAAAKGQPDHVAAALLEQAAELAVHSLLTQRDREKAEALERLIWALMCGVVPKHLMQRMQELGMGHLVERIVQDMVGSGRGISRAMLQELQAVASSLGLSLHLAPEQHNFEALAEHDARLGALGRTNTGAPLDAASRARLALRTP